VQEQARQAYRLFRDNPSHPSLRFKKVSDRDPVYSARISLNYRSLGLLEGEAITWFWIGNHADYERLLASL
jgi:hypothetical protein